jgi:hypothetical protein
MSTELYLKDVKTTFDRPRNKREINIKIALEKCVNWVQLDQDMM